MHTARQQLQQLHMCPHQLCAMLPVCLQIFRHLLAVQQQGHTMNPPFQMQSDQSYVPHCHYWRSETQSLRGAHSAWEAERMPKQETSSCRRTHAPL